MERLAATAAFAIIYIANSNDPNSRQLGKGEYEYITNIMIPDMLAAGATYEDFVHWAKNATGEVSMVYDAPDILLHLPFNGEPEKKLRYVEIIKENDIVAKLFRYPSDDKPLDGYYVTRNAFIDMVRGMERVH